MSDGRTQIPLRVPRDELADAIAYGALDQSTGEQIAAPAPKPTVHDLAAAREESAA